MIVFLHGYTYDHLDTSSTMFFFKKKTNKGAHFIAYNFNGFKKHDILYFI